MEGIEQPLDHRGLYPITNARSGGRVQPDRQICSENVSEGDQYREAGLASAGLDLGEVALVHLRRGGDRPLTQIGIEAELTKLGPQPRPELASRASDLRSRTRTPEPAREGCYHERIRPPCARLAVIGDLPPSTPLSARVRWHRAIVFGSKSHGVSSPLCSDGPRPSAGPLRPSRWPEPSESMARSHQRGRRRTGP